MINLSDPERVLAAWIALAFGRPDVAFRTLTEPVPPKRERPRLATVGGVIQEDYVESRIA